MMGFLDRLVRRRGAGPSAAETAPAEAEQQCAGGPSLAALDLIQAAPPSIAHRARAVRLERVVRNILREEFPLLYRCWRSQRRAG